MHFRFGVDLQRAVATAASYIGNGKVYITGNLSLPIQQCSVGCYIPNGASIAIQPPETSAARRIRIVNFSQNEFAFFAIHKGACLQIRNVEFAVVGSTEKATIAVLEDETATVECTDVSKPEDMRGPVRCQLPKIVGPFLALPGGFKMGELIMYKGQDAMVSYEQKGVCMIMSDGAGTPLLSGTQGIVVGGCDNLVYVRFPFSWSRVKLPPNALTAFTDLRPVTVGIAASDKLARAAVECLNLMRLLLRNALTACTERGN